MGQGSSSNEQQEQPNTPKTIQQFSTQNKHDPSERIEGDVMPITISKYNQDPALANAFKVLICFSCLFLFLSFTLFLIISSRFLCVLYIIIISARNVIKRLLIQLNSSLLTFSMIITCSLVILNNSVSI